MSQSHHGLLGRESRAQSHRIRPPERPCSQRSLAKKNDSLSIPIASDVIFSAMTSRSENLGTTPRRGILPYSLTKLPATCLQMSRNFRILHISRAYDNCKSEDWAPLIR